MSVEDFFWDAENQTVRWSYKGATYNEKIDNMHQATVIKQKDFIYIEAGHNYYQDQMYYLSYDGRRIFTCDKLKGKISWQFEDQLIDIDCENILSAMLYVDHGLVIVITVSNKVDQRLKGFSLDGMLLFEKEPPQDFIFIYLSESMNKPTVVSDGGIPDASGRYRWHFTIDTKTGELSKIGLAY